MMRLNYRLTIEVPSEVPPELLAEVNAEAEPHDRDWSERVRRYVGGTLNDAESFVGGELPEGWSCRIDDVEKVDQVNL